MQLKIDLNDETIKAEATKKALDSARNIAAYYVSEHFSTGQYYGTKKGFGTIQIQEQIDKLLTSDDLNVKISELVAKHFDAALEEAVKHACTQKAKKIAFNSSQVNNKQGEAK